MASLYKKVISGKPYWYLREMGWVDGKPKMVSERYVGTAADIEALLDAREGQMLPERTRHLDFGAVAAAWGLLADLGAAAVIDEETGARPPGLPLSLVRTGAGRAEPGGGSLLQARARGLVASTTAADRSTKNSARRWITAGSGTRCTRVPLDALPRIEEKLALVACAPGPGWNDSVALDMTNLRRSSIPATPGRRSRSGNKAKQKRAASGWSAWASS